MAVTDFDRRMMAAAIRYSYRHLGRTGTNPSVSTLLVNEIGGEPVIVGRGLTALGGRPHAETQAISDAGEYARGATAYVSLEPCAHHGSTPPCAEGLIKAGISRVVAATTDPDHRVSGRGYAILREAGLAVEENVLAGEAERALAGYLTRRRKNRPHISLKLALSRDAKIGRRGGGQVSITGQESRMMSHVARASTDAILIGIGTALEDDPSLTCRLPGLEERSPTRIVLDSALRLPIASALVRTAQQVPLIVATAVEPSDPRFQELLAAGCKMMACDLAEGGIALPEMMEDLAGQGISTVLVEGGAEIAQSFLNAGLVDRIDLYEGPLTIGPEGIDAPVSPTDVTDRFELKQELSFGDDQLRVFERTV